MSKVTCYFIGAEFEGDMEVPGAWPAFPDGTLDGTIADLAEFPVNTPFLVVDQAEGALLCEAGRRSSSDRQRSRPLFVSVWQEHLADAARQGLVEGIAPSGKRASAPQGHFSLNECGKRFAVASELTEEKEIWPLFGKIRPYLVRGEFDTAVREVAVTLETAMRDLVAPGERLYGVALVDVFLQAISEFDFVDAVYLASYKAKYDRFFVFVRNEFAHSRSALDMATALKLVVMGCRLVNHVRGFRPPESKPS